MNEQNDRFTKRARRILNIAESEAQRLNHNYIGTEHLLLGMVEEKQGLAAKVLQELSIDLSELKERIEADVGRGTRQSHGKPLVAPRAKEVIELAAYLADQLGHIYVGTEHLIIAIVEEGEGLAANILKEYVTLDQVIAEVIENVVQSSRTLPTERLFTDESLARVQQTLTSIEQGTKWSLSSTTTDVFKLRRKRMVDQIGRAAVQEERNRLARDLHDSIKQQLFSISTSAAAAQAHWQSDPEGSQKALEDVQQSARAAMVEMDAMLQHLSPTPLATSGLLDALRQQCEALEYRTGAKVSTSFDPLPSSEQLPVGMQETLFRMTQEALSNVARHARATNVNVRLECSDNEKHVKLEVRDDGQGFDVEGADQGMGLTNLVTRAEGIGGQTEIRSKKGEGTSVRIVIPYV